MMKSDNHQDLIDAVFSKYPSKDGRQTSALSRAFARVVSQKEIQQDLFRVSIESAKKKKAPNYRLIEF